MNGKPSYECDFWKEIIEKIVSVFQISLLVVRSREVGRKFPGHLQTSPSHSRNHDVLTAGRGGTTSSKVFQEKERAETWAKMNPRVWIWLPEDSGKMARVILKLYDPNLPSGWWNFKAYIRQAAQGRDTLITYLICCHYPHDITVAFSDYSWPWIPKSIFPDELVWIFFLPLVSVSYFLSASLLRSLLVFLVSPKLPNVQKLFLDCSLLVFLSPDHSDDISNRLAWLLLDIYSSAFPPLIFLTVFRARVKWSHHNCSFKLKEFDKWSRVGSWQAMCLSKVQWPSVDQSPYPFIMAHTQVQVALWNFFVCLSLFVFQLYTIIPKSCKLTVRESNLKRLLNFSLLNISTIAAFF